MTKRRTIEVIVETEELLIVNRRTGALPRNCPSCGARIQPPAPATQAVSPYADARALSSPDIVSIPDGEGMPPNEKAG